MNLIKKKSAAIDSFSFIIYDDSLTPQLPGMDILASVRHEQNRFSLLPR